jgi:hypothetical protein
MFPKRAPRFLNKRMRDQMLRQFALMLLSAFPWRRALNAQ